MYETRAAQPARRELNEYEEIEMLHARNDIEIPKKLEGRFLLLSRRCQTRMSTWCTTSIVAKAAI